MNTVETTSTLRGLKLSGMADRYELILELSGKHEGPDAHTMIAMLAESEKDYRRKRKTEVNLKQARLRYQINAQEVDCSPARGLSREQWLVLCECSFIENATNIIIIGPTGVGKSAVACALGRQACLQGYKSMYFNVNRLIEEIKAAKLNGTYLKFLDQIAKTPLLILDDFGLKPLDKDVRVAFYEILEDRSGKGATIVTSQQPIPNWYERFGDSTLAEACLDRLTGNSEKINLSGASRRFKKKK